MKIVILLCLCLVVFGFKIETPPLKSKIPEYMGLGYHLLYGNAFTNHIDEGFRAPIFSFSYNRNQRT